MFQKLEVKWEKTVSAKTAAFIHCFVTTPVCLLWPGRLSALDVKQSIERTRSQFSGWLLTPCLHLWVCAHMVHSSIYTRGKHFTTLSCFLEMHTWDILNLVKLSSRYSGVPLKRTCQGGKEVLLSREVRNASSRNTTIIQSSATWYQVNKSSFKLFTERVFISNGVDIASGTIHTEQLHVQHSHAAVNSAFQ